MQGEGTLVWQLKVLRTLPNQTHEMSRAGLEGELPEKAESGSQVTAMGGHASSPAMSLQRLIYLNSFLHHQNLIRKHGGWPVNLNVCGAKGPDTITAHKHPPGGLLHSADGFSTSSASHRRPTPHGHSSKGILSPAFTSLLSVTRLVPVHSLPLVVDVCLPLLPSKLTHLNGPKSWPAASELQLSEQ